MYLKYIYIYPGYELKLGLRLPDETSSQLWGEKQDCGGTDLPEGHGVVGHRGSGHRALRAGHPLEKGRGAPRPREQAECGGLAGAGTRAWSLPYGTEPGCHSPSSPSPRTQAAPRAAAAAGTRRAPSAAACQCPVSGERPPRPGTCPGTHFRPLLLPIVPLQNGCGFLKKNE